MTETTRWRVMLAFAVVPLSLIASCWLAGPAGLPVPAAAGTPDRCEPSGRAGPTREPAFLAVDRARDLGGAVGDRVGAGFVGDRDSHAGEVTWSMGDGRQVVCHGPGTPYRPGDPPGAASPDCGYTYRSSSAGQPGERYQVSATTRWRITWTSTGVISTSGTLPDLLRTSSIGLRVAEVQTIN